MSKETRLRWSQMRIAGAWQGLYREHVEAHDADRGSLATQEMIRLRDPEYRATVGLPTCDMPDESLAALAYARALDKIEPTKPKVNRYENIGRPPTVLDRCYSRQ